MWFLRGLPFLTHSHIEVPNCTQISWTLVHMCDQPRVNPQHPAKRRWKGTGRSCGHGSKRKPLGDFGSVGSTFLLPNEAFWGTPTFLTHSNVDLLNTELGSWWLQNDPGRIASLYVRAARWGSACWEVCQVVVWGVGSPLVQRHSACFYLLEWWRVDKLGVKTLTSKSAEVRWFVASSLRVQWQR